MSVYGAAARMLNDLYFLNLDSVSTKLHRSLACSKCRRVFRKPYGLERHFRQIHADGVDLEQLLRIGDAARGFTTSLEVGQGTEEAQEDPPIDVVSIESPGQNPISEDDNLGRNPTPEDESHGQDSSSSSSSSEDEPLISSEEEDAADPHPTPRKQTSPPEEEPEVILLSSDEENDDDDAFVASSDTSSVVDSEAETLAEGSNGTDSGFESNKASSPPVAGTLEEVRNKSIQKWINGIEVSQAKDGEGPKRGSTSPPACDLAIQDLPKRKAKKITTSRKDGSKIINAAMEAEKKVVTSEGGKREMPEVRENPVEIKEDEGTQNYSSVPNLQSKLKKRLNVKAIKMSPRNTVMAQNSPVRILKEKPLVIAPAPKPEAKPTREAEEHVTIAAGGNGGVVSQTKKAPKPLELQPCINGNQMPKDGNQFRKRKLLTGEKDDVKSSNQGDDFPRAKGMKINVARTIEEQQGEKLTIGESKIQRSEPAGELDQDWREPKVGKISHPHISLKKAKTIKIRKKLKERHNNEVSCDVNTGSEKRVNLAHKRQKWLFEGLGTRELSKPKKWLSSFKIPKVKNREDLRESRSPPSSSESEKENASPLERVSIFKKSHNNVEEGNDKNYFQKPKLDSQRRSEDFKHTKKAKKRVRWREPLVRVIRIPRERPFSRPAGRSSLHDHSFEEAFHQEDEGANEGRIVEQIVRESRNEETVTSVDEETTQIKIVKERREKRIVSERSHEQPELELEERIIKEVKTVLNPFYSREKISRSSYKEIMQKCVPKIPRSNVIDSVKVKKLVYGYVNKYTYEKRLNV